MVTDREGVGAAWARAMYASEPLGPQNAQGGVLYLTASRTTIVKQVSRHELHLFIFLGVVF
jgi:hypothetical protein